MTIQPTLFPLLVIIGPTASGKSALALAVAKTRSAGILSVDSMQVYQHMDIGTAKATAAEQELVPHHLIDWVRPDESFNAARFVTLADAVLAESQRCGKKIVATGGTPMYFKALFTGLFQGPSADEKIRQRLRAVENAQLHQLLVQVDPIAAGRIHVADRKRLIRALEVHEVTGRPISELQSQWDSAGPPRHPAVWIGLRWERDALNRRINARVRAMIESGWIDEVNNLLKNHSPLSKTAAEATGYAELIAHVQGKLSLDDAVEKIKIATRQLARRQMKFFRRFPGVHWIDGDQPFENLLHQTLNAWP